LSELVRGLSTCSFGSSKARGTYEFDWDDNQTRNKLAR
jgi:hypothetical protein